jgi:hypothetical protein
MLMMKAGASWKKYFPSFSVLFTSGLFGGLFVSFQYKSFSLPYAGF